MRPATYDPTSLPVRILALGGVAGLAALTLVNEGATRMYATPWTWLLALVCAAPVVTLWLRAVASPTPLRLPPRGWLVIATAVAVVPLASAMASPYRATSLLQVSVPVAAAALFLVLHDWDARDPARCRRTLAFALGLGAAAVAAASFGAWALRSLSLPPEVIFSRALLDGRNPFPLGHSNYTAGLMLLALPWLFVAARRCSPSLRAAAAVAFALALLNLFLSGSRGGFLALAALGAAGLIGAGLGWKRLLLAGVGIVILAGGLALANPRIRQLLLSANATEAPNASTVQRAAMLEAALAMGRDQPLLGWGPGTTPLVYPRYRHRLSGGAENVLQLHSTPAHLWAETGAAGLLAAAGFLFLALRNGRQSPPAAAALAGYSVLALTDYQLDVPVFAAALATLAVLLVPTAPSPPAATGARRAVAGVALGAAVLIGLLGARDPAPALNTTALALEPAQHDRAVALLRDSLALNPDQEIAHFNLGWLLVVPDPEAAEKHFRAAAHLVPDKGGVYFGLGLACLNQGRSDEAARAFALECINDPLFLASPWWNVPAIAATRGAAARHFSHMLEQDIPIATLPAWVGLQVPLLKTLAPRLGEVSPGPEKNYRRDRIGYPVLMRNLDLPVPTDLYVVREDPRFPASVLFTLPSKGWLPSPRLLKLLDDPAP